MTLRERRQTSNVSRLESTFNIYSFETRRRKIHEQEQVASRYSQRNASLGWQHCESGHWRCGWYTWTAPTLQWSNDLAAARGSTGCGCSLDKYVVADVYIVSMQGVGKGSIFMGISSGQAILLVKNMQLEIRLVTTGKD